MVELNDVRWDLSPLYSSIHDTKIKSDVLKIKKLTSEVLSFKGSLNKNLEIVLTKIISIEELASKLFAFFYLMASRDADNPEIKKIMSKNTEEVSSYLSSLAFFDIELSKIPQKTYSSLIKSSPLLTKHKSYLDKIRKNSNFLLDENVEVILSKTSPFSVSEWDDLMDEEETKLLFPLKRKKYTLSQILHISSTSHSSKIRQKALDSLNETLLSSGYLNLRQRSLNLVMGHKNLLDKERGFSHIMQARNIDNNLDDNTVSSLHNAVLHYGSLQGKRYYNIIKKILHKKVLLWSDRNAPLPFESKSYINWDKALDIVLSSYRNFSPLLADLIQDSIDNHRIDAPVYNGKTSGAYNYTIVCNSSKVYTWTFLNYMGSIRDVMTLAHELGHSVHGQLAGKAQGTLQVQAPMAYAETASIFGEMLTFEYLISNISDKKEKLALLLSKSNDWINSVNRQISFSFFEQKAHTKRKDGKLSNDDFNSIWLDVSKQMYGDEGEIFTFKNMQHLWSYVGHFMRPFYVYAYAFGELFTQSLFAVKNNIPNFESLYIDMLKAGSSKNAVELMKPFGLNPNLENFWLNGINSSIKKWLDEAEVLMQELKI